jgi:hypothetical protein
MHASGAIDNLDIGVGDDFSVVPVTAPLIVALGDWETAGGVA